LEERSAAALTIGAESIWTAEAAALRIKPFGDLTFGEATLRATEPTGAAEVTKAASEVAKATLATGIVEELAHIEAALHVRVKEVAGALLHAATGTATGAALTKVTTRELAIGTATETTGRIKVGVKEVAERVTTRATGAALSEVTTRELAIGSTAEATGATGATEAKALLRLKEVAPQATALVELKDRALPPATSRIATGTTKRVATGAATKVTTERVTTEVTTGCTKAAAELVTTGCTKAATGAAHHLEEVVTSSTCV
jgi:hypothetical protein